MEPMGKAYVVSGPKASLRHAFSGNSDVSTLWRRSPAKHKATLNSFLTSAIPALRTHIAALNMRAQYGFATYEDS